MIVNHVGLESPRRLVLDATLAAPRAAVWRGWTEPHLLKQWFCPKPWFVPEADFELKPGGRMNTVMAGPNGERMENRGVFLEIVPQTRLVFTDAFTEGFVPSPERFMTGRVELSDEGESVRMIWSALHASDADAAKHLAMGFEAGWTAAARQLEDIAAALSGSSAAGLARPVRTCLWFARGGLEAAQFYVSLLPDSRIEAGFANGSPAEPMIVGFTLAGAPFMILNGGPMYKPTPAASISVLTKTQDETDRLWSALVADGGAESRCGWLVDRYGVSWQIVPEALPRYLNAGDPEAAARVRDAFMTMTKIDIGTLEAACSGEKGDDR